MKPWCALPVYLLMIVLVFWCQPGNASEPEVGKVVFDPEGAPTRGPSGAPVTFYEISDFA